eukprot:1630373-Pyramimonas_sp.AAC.1
MSRLLHSRVRGRPFGGGPVRSYYGVHGATKRVSGVPAWTSLRAGSRTRALPLRPSVEIFLGHETCE